jgi:hypothetical protein
MRFEKSIRTPFNTSYLLFKRGIMTIMARVPTSRSDTVPSRVSPLLGIKPLTDCSRKSNHIVAAGYDKGSMDRSSHA